jgi:repressor LexA
MRALTDKQRRVFEFVENRLAMGRAAPSVREIAAAFGWRSKRAAECHLKALVEKGWLLSEPGLARSLRVAFPESKPQITRPDNFETHPVEIPLFGSIPAGWGQDREESAEGCVSVDVATLGFQPTRNTFALKVQGDSMVGRHICDGDIAIFEHGPEPRPGQIVAALIDRKSTLKTFLVQKGKPFLKAENPRFPDLIPSEELVIQGVLRAILRRMDR